MQTFIFVYGVRCEVEAESKEKALQKMLALQREELCSCKKTDCACIYEGQIAIWHESQLDEPTL